MRLYTNSISSKDLYKLQYQARSKVKFDTIVEAIKIYSGQRGVWDSCFFQSLIKSHGWKFIGQGLYKICMAKNSIIIKFTKDSMGWGTLKDEWYSYQKIELTNEYNQWANPPDPSLKKYLPKIYALIDDRVLIQDRILGSCILEYNICSVISEIKDIADKYHLYDYVSNHGHTLKGNVKFFDYVC